MFVSNKKGWNSGYIHVYWMNFGIFTQCGLTSQQYSCTVTQVFMHCYTSIHALLHKCSCTVTQVFMPYWNFDDEKWEVAWAKVLQLKWSISRLASLPGPTHAAFHHLQYGKAGRALYTNSHMCDVGIERMTEKKFNCAWVHWAQKSMKNKDNR